MTENQQNIDEFFLRELGNATETPPAIVWEGLEKRLDGRGGSSKRSIMFWCCCILFVVLMIGGGLFALHQWQAHQPVQKDNAAPLEQILTMPPVPEQKTEFDSAMAAKETLIDTSPKWEETAEESAFGHELHFSKQNKTKVSEPASANTNINVNTNTQQSIASNNASGKLQNGQISNAAKSMATKRNALLAAVPKSSKSNESSDLSNMKKALSAGAGSQTNAKKGQNTPLGINESTVNGAGNVAQTAGNKNNTKPMKAAPSSGTQFASAPEKAPVSQASTKVSAPQEETVVFRPKKKASPSPAINTTYRGLSAVPEEMKAELEEDALLHQKEASEEAVALVPTTSKPSQKLNAQSAKQTENIAQARATNPLSGAPLATDKIDEIPSATPNDPSINASGSGGGGGASATQKDKIKRALNMTIGVKAGYEQGFANYTAGKVVANLFAEVNFSKRVSFILQPGIKFAKANQQFSTVVGSYYDAGAVNSSLYNMRVDTGGTPTGFNDFAYQQTYDSIVASSVSNNRYVEIEIPFLFRYKLDKHLSVLAGLNITLGKLLGASSILQTIRGLSISDTVFNHFGTTAPAPPSSFAHTGATPISAYKDPSNALVSSPIRFGYSLGLSYSIQDRIMIDLLIQQNLSGMSNLSSKEMKQLLSQPYVRLSFGYALFGAKKK